MVVDKTGIRRAIVHRLEELMAWPRRAATNPQISYQEHLLPYISLARIILVDRYWNCEEWSRVIEVHALKHSG